MDNTQERFVPEDEVPSLKKQGHDISEEFVEVGDEFDFKGRKFRVRKVTNKDIICRPVSWSQGDVDALVSSVLDKPAHAQPAKDELQ